MGIMRLPQSKLGMSLGFVYLAIAAFIISLAGSDAGGVLAIILMSPWSLILPFCIAYGILPDEAWLAQSKTAFIGSFVIGAWINALILYFVGRLLGKIVLRLKRKHFDVHKATSRAPF